MDRFSPPQPQRFDPITGLWSSPEGLLHDPARAGGERREPVELIGPIPPELSRHEPDGDQDARLISRSQRLRWVFVAVATGWIALITLVGSLGDCLDVSGCTPAAGHTMVAGAIGAVCVGLAAYATACVRSGTGRAGGK